MASTQNLWLEYHKTERLERTSSHGASTTVRYRDLIDRTRKTLDKPVQLQAMILANLAESLVAILPSDTSPSATLSTKVEASKTIGVS
jgi:hypothetical protein